MKPIVSAFFAMQIAWLGFGVAAMGQTIKVGVVTPLTGRYAAIGNELKHGYDIAVEKNQRRRRGPSGEPALTLGVDRAR